MIMFHVKRCSVGSLSAAAALKLTLVVLGLASMPMASAALNKCTGVDGKATFSDQPCPHTSTVEVLKEAPRAPAQPRTPARAPASIAAEEAAKADAAYGRFKRRLSADCAASLPRMEGRARADAGPEPNAAPPSPKCEAQMLESLEVEMEFAAKAYAANACQVQRKLLQERRSGFATMDAGAQSAFRKIEQEVARNCR